MLANAKRLLVPGSRMLVWEAKREALTEACEQESTFGARQQAEEPLSSSSPGGRRRTRCCCSSFPLSISSSVCPVVDFVASSRVRAFTQECEKSSKYNGYCHILRANSNYDISY